MTELPLLQALGLTEAEAKLYLVLLECGPSSIRHLAAVAGVNRGIAYDSLKRLVNLNLASYNQKGQRRQFVAESPDKIYQLVEEKKRQLIQLEEQAKDMVPRLLATGERRVGEPVVRFYEDDDGIASILRDVLATVGKLQPKEYCAYSSRPMRQYLYRRFPNFTRRRLKEGLFVRVIAVGEGGDPVETAERRYLPEPDGERLSSYTIIYGPKVAMISVSPDHTPYGVVVEEPGVAAMQRHLFNGLWQTLEQPPT